MAAFSRTVIISITAHTLRNYAGLCSGILYTKLQLVVRFRNDITVKLRVHIDDLTPVLVGARYSRRKSKVQILTFLGTGL